MVYTEPPLFVAGDPLTATQLNQYLRDNFKALADPWTVWSPSLTNWTLGNGTITAAYVKVGRLVLWRMAYTVGSTDTPSGTFQVDLPYQPWSLVTGTPLGQFRLNDADVSGAAGRRGYLAEVASSGGARALDPSNGNFLTATNPWTWASDDTILGQGMYESAA